MAIPTGLLGCAVVAVDGTVQSISALNWALDNLQLRPGSDAGEGGSIVLVHVQPPPSIAAGMNPGTILFGGPGMEMPAFTAAIEEHQRTITEAIMNRALEICADRNVSVKTQVLVGNPRKKICEAVDIFQADLLVIGSRAFSRLRRFFRGSVSRYCGKYASCPVIVVKGDSGEVFRIGDKP